MNSGRIKSFLRKATLFDVSVLSSVLGIYLCLALATITKFSIWFDEAFSSYIIRFDFWQVTLYTAQDVQPPLYYWLLKLWTMLVGVSEAGVRSLSVVFGVLAVIFVYLLVRRQFNKYAAALSIFFMAISPFFIRYSQEARMYTMVAAIAFAATYALVVARQTNARKAWVWYAVLVALGMWTHYFTALIWLAHVVWLIIDTWKPGQNWKRFAKEFLRGKWVRAYKLAVLLYVPWIPAFLIQAGIVQAAGFWIPEITAETVPNFISNAFLFREIEDVKAWAVIWLTGVICVGGFAVWRVYKQDISRRFLALLLCLVVVPVMLITIVSLPPFRPVFVDRYILTAGLTVPVLLGVGLAVARIKRYVRALALVLTAGIFLLGTLHVYEIGNFNKNSQLANSTRKVIEEIYTHSATGQPIIADSPWLFYEAVFYATSEHPVYFLRSSTEFNYGSLAMLKQNEQYKIKDLAAFGAEHKSVWYVSTLTEGKRNPPAPEWNEKQELIIDDEVNKKPLYRAVQYETN